MVWLPRTGVEPRNFSSTAKCDNVDIILQRLHYKGLPDKKV